MKPDQNPLGKVVIKDRKFWTQKEDGTLVPITLRQFQSFNVAVGTSNLYKSARQNGDER